MKFWKNCVLFYVGGAGYYILELLWRGWSHGSMFLLGGVCFLLIGRVCRRLRLPLAVRLLVSAGMVTALELLTGLLVNADHRIWDYSAQRWHYRGQICLNASLLWIPVSLMAMGLYTAAEKRLGQKN